MKHKSLVEKHKSDISRKNLYLILGYTVFIYKNNKLLEGSPFYSYKEASKISNIPLYKISEYIDTNIEINGFYIYSKKK
jgi:hypothetical protein